MGAIANSFFTAEGAVLEAGSNQPFWLNEPDQIWFIQSGKIDVFAVPMHDEGTVGSRLHFFRAEHGMALLGLNSDGAATELRFLAVGAPGTRLYKLPVARLTDLAASPAGNKELAALLDGWVRCLYDGLARGYLPKETEALEPGLEIDLPGATAARPYDDVIWVKHLKGKSILAEVEDLLVSPDRGYVPLAPSAWVQTLEEVTLACLDTPAMLQEGAIWTSLRQFYSLVSQWSAINVAHAAEDEGTRLLAKADSQKQAVVGAVSLLSAVLEDDQSKAGFIADRGDSLYGACQLICHSLGMSLKPRSGYRSSAQRDPLGHITKSARIRTRRVMLAGTWWHRDGGPLLGFLKENERPVALLPITPTSYELVDPVTNVRKPIGEEEVHSLKPMAFTFYRPFPAKALNVWDMIKFGLRKTEADILMIVMMGVAGGLLGMLLPIVTGMIFDTVIPSARQDQLTFLTIALVVAALASSIFHITLGIALLRVESKSDAFVQSAVWDRLLSLPIPFFRNYTSGDLALRANGINAIREVLAGAVLSSLLSGVFSLFNFCLLFFYSVKLALVAAGLVAVSVLATAFISLINLRYQRPVFALEGKISGLVLQFISGISKLRVAGAEVHAYAVWARAFSEQKRLDLKAGNLYNGFHVFNDCYPILTTICLFAAMAFWMGSGMSTGKFLAFNAAFTTFLFATLEMSSSMLSIIHAIPIYERAKPIMDTLPEVDEAKSDPGDLKGKIEFGHVSFRYKEDGPLVIRDLSLQINPGEFVAIVGPSGSGKSTLTRLLLGFEKPEAGTIYYDGQDLAALDVQAVRRQIGVVLQSGKLMPGDIYQNIVGSSPHTIDDAWDAARQAGFDADIEQMPMGMHTVLSEGAGTLSGGQRQRLMIARAIVSRPRILIFDEATSALDNHTQAIVSRSLEELQATRIVIAHRLSTIINADRIFVVQAGRLIQTGNYEELVNQPGPFAELAKRQLA